MEHMNSVELYFLAVGTFVTCRTWLTVASMIDAIIQFGLDGGASDEEE